MSRFSHLVCASLALSTVCPSANAETVVLLHGLARSPLAMMRLERNLQARGYRVKNLGYPSRQKDIRRLASETLGPVFNQPSNGSIHIVTHSLGGILVRQYLHDHGVPDSLGRVVMIAPPNQGSEIVDRLGHLKLFHWINGPAGCELGTDVRATPQTLGPLPSDVEIGVIAGDFSWNPLYSALITGCDDGKVSVEHTHVEGETDHLTLHASHTWLPYRRQTLEAVDRFLRQGHF